MSGTTQKHRNFVTEPMRNKPVSDIPGVGKVLGERLKEAGFGRASTVLGQYLVLNRDEERFMEWMADTCNANSKQASHCYYGLNEWCNNFL